MQSPPATPGSPRKRRRSVDHENPSGHQAKTARRILSDMFDILDQGPCEDQATESTEFEALRLYIMKAPVLFPRLLWRAEKAATSLVEGSPGTPGTLKRVFRSRNRPVPKPQDDSTMNGATQPNYEEVLDRSDECIDLRSGHTACGSTSTSARARDVAQTGPGAADLYSMKSRPRLGGQQTLVTEMTSSAKDILEKMRSGRLGDDNYITWLESQAEKKLLRITRLDAEKAPTLPWPQVTFDINLTRQLDMEWLARKQIRVLLLLAAIKHNGKDHLTTDAVQEFLHIIFTPYTKSGARNLHAALKGFDDIGSTWSAGLRQLEQSTATAVTSHERDFLRAAHRAVSLGTPRSGDDPNSSIPHFMRFFARWNFFTLYEQLAEQVKFNNELNKRFRQDYGDKPNQSAKTLVLRYFAKSAPSLDPDHASTSSKRIKKAQGRNPTPSPLRYLKEGGRTAVKLEQAFGFMHCMMLAPRWSNATATMSGVSMDAMLEAIKEECTELVDCFTVSNVYIKRCLIEGVSLENLNAPTSGPMEYLGQIEENIDMILPYGAKMARQQQV